jgi:serine O-acetyltransferase
MSSDILELGNTMADAIREDALAVCRRDPATDTALEVVLFSKGYAALVCHRAAHRLYKGKQKFTALFLQSQASAIFGLDIHPLAQIGYCVMLDHGTGVVVGEMAVVGDGCTILHGVTLGGTGKDHGDRHPKVRKKVLIGAGASLLGNIHIGDRAKIGAGSVVLRVIPPGTTAVGSPAKIVGRSKEMRPGSEIDEIMENATLLHKSESSNTISTVLGSESKDSSSGMDHVCPY